MLNTLMHHYVAHASVIASLRLKKGNTQGADEQRISLIKELESVIHPDEQLAVGKCLEILRNTDWYTSGNLTAFMKQYDEKIHVSH